MRRKAVRRNVLIALLLASLCLSILTPLVRAQVHDPGWFCRVGVQREDAPPTAFLFGDSHAGSMLPVFSQVAHEIGGSFLYTLTKACTSEEPCLERNQEILEYVRDHRIPSVVIAFRWSNYDMPETPGADTWMMEAWLDRTIADYRKIGVHVYLLDDNPAQRRLPSDALRRSAGNDEAINRDAITRGEFIARKARTTSVLARYAGDDVTVVDFTDAYCRKDICPLVKDGKFLYGDLHHLSFTGAMLIEPELEKVFETVPNPTP